jgi:UDP-N-acetylmuramoyl-L-alanyl-D-glutamate--2,6-diaminopimelate ligase
MAETSTRPIEADPKPIGGLLDRLPTGRLTGSTDVLISGATHDSRQVLPGDLYIARAGEHTHGIAHVADAVAAGASAVLTDPQSADLATSAGASAVVVVDEPRAAMGPAAAWAYGDPAAGLLMFGITGTNGKTTTAYLVDAGLRAAGRRTGLIGTIETRVGDDTISSARTTPEATELHALLAVMRERGVDSVAMEVSSHALALGRVDGLTFDIAAFTNLSQDHLDFHGDMESYFAAKAALFTPQHSRHGVVTIDDEWGRRLADQAGVEVTTIGVMTGDWRRTDVGGLDRQTRLEPPSGPPVVLGTGLFGEVNAANAALAYVSLAVAGVDPGQAAAGIAGLALIPGRMEQVDAGQPFLAIVDYAHTPDAVQRLLAEAHNLTGPDGRVLVVLGCGGDRDRDKRPLMGLEAARGSDLAIFTNDNPRSEDPAAILDAMHSRVPADARVLVEPDRRRAIEAAVRTARPGDVVVVAGKGHELGQEIAGEVFPFDDREVLRSAISSGAES